MTTHDPAHEPRRGPPREIPAALRLAGFGLGATAVFLAAVALGGTVGPVGDPVSASPSHATDHPDGNDDDGGTAGTDSAGREAEPIAAVAELPGGLQVSQDGYTLTLAENRIGAGDREVAFTIDDSEGRPLREYRIEHEKQLHLIAVRRDFTGYQHVHPERAADYTWRAPLSLTPGTWRLFADFTPGDVPGDVPGAEGLTLGADLHVRAAARVQEQSEGQVRTADLGRYRVQVAGALRAGEASELDFTVTRDGAPVEELQPYLGARGHLVALRTGDLAYLHVHPIEADTSSGHEVGFSATAPSAGSYRLYLDFRHQGAVRTASFVLQAGDPGGDAGQETPPAETSADHHDDDHDH